jgi:hypothetical protein
MIRVDHPALPTFQPPTLPVWAQSPSTARTTAESAFLAGAALNALDALVRAAPPWIGAWRQRLALSCAVAVVRGMGLREDETQLRDAWHWRAAGADPGPAGRILAAWRRLASSSVECDEARLHRLADEFGAHWTAPLAGALENIDNRAQAAAPFAAAGVIVDVLAARPDADLLAWPLADLAIARAMRWTIPVPLLIMTIDKTALGAKTQGRLPRGREDLERAVCLAIAEAATEAFRLAGDIARRADRLIKAAPRLRAKGAGDALQRLLDDDAVSGALTTPNLTRWASRRLFERLAALDAVRELTGRPTFRLYGL